MCHRVRWISSLTYKIYVRRKKNNMETTLIDITEKISKETFLKKNPGEHSLGTFLRNISTLLRHISKTHSSVMFRNDIPKRYSTRKPIETLYSLEIFLRIIPSHHNSFIMRKQHSTEQNRTEQKSSYIKWCMKTSVTDNFINLQKSIYHWRDRKSVV